MWHFAEPQALLSQEVTSLFGYHTPMLIISHVQYMCKLIKKNIELPPNSWCYDTKSVKYNFKKSTVLTTRTSIQ